MKRYHSLVRLSVVDINTIDLSHLDFWSGSRELRESTFWTLRQQDSIHFFAEPHVPGFPEGPGYWALVRHEDIWHASRNPDLFCNGRGFNITDLTVEMNEFFGSMLAMDDPKHVRLRTIVSKGFTPREIARVDEFVRERARTIIDRVLERHAGHEFDFVEEVAAPFPLQIICSMMGIPESDERQILEWTNVILGASDPDFGGGDGNALERLINVAVEIYGYAQALGEARLANPTDDLTSVLMHAVVDGERLTPQEFGSFFILLVVAGNETTRNAISHGLLALTQHADQRERWFGDFEALTRSAVEEIVRWSSPVIHFRRTATRDTEIRGTRVSAGDKLVLWYNSGNRDDSVYPDPYRFDVTRQPNPAQIGFGAGGPHFCLGANLARREIAVMFDEIRRRVPNLRVTGEPAFLRSNFINGIKSLPARVDA